MSRLQSCYFCGEIGDALTAFEVVPADLADESNQRTVVVCSTCHRKLDTLVAPLRTLAAGGGEVGDDPTDDTATDDTVADETGHSTDAESPLAPPNEDDGTVVTSDERDDESADVPTVDDDHSSTEDAGVDEITFSDTDAVGGTTSDSAATADDEVAFTEVDEAHTDGTEESILGGADDAGHQGVVGDDGDEGHDGDGDADGQTTDAPDSVDADRRTEADSDDSSGETDTGVSDDPPTGYRKVVRLLQNREFPVERESFVDLASNAYELAETDVSASLDRLVERGALVENDGQLQKP